MCVNVILLAQFKGYSNLRIIINNTQGCKYFFSLERTYNITYMSVLLRHHLGQTEQLVVGHPKKVENFVVQNYTTLVLKLFLVCGKKVLQ